MIIHNILCFLRNNKTDYYDIENERIIDYKPVGAIEEMRVVGSEKQYDKLFKLIKKYGINIEQFERINRGLYWAELHDYQIKAIEEIEKWEKIRLKGGILGFKMGLGKTITTLAYIEKKCKKRVLIICDKSNLPNWINQIEEHYGGIFNYLVLHKDYIDIKKVKINKGIILTTYEFIASSKKNNNQQIYGIKWDIVVVDEVNKLVNRNSKTAKALYDIESSFKLVLSGTPIINYSSDLYSIFKFLGLDIIFKEWNVDYYFNNRLDKHLYMLDYKEAGIKLPKLEERIIELKLSKHQEILYELFIEKLKKAYFSFKRDEKTYVAQLSLFQYLRQIIIDPNVINFNKILKLDFNDKEIKKIQNIINKKEIYPKIDELSNIISQEYEKGILVFSSFKKILKNAQEQLKKIHPHITSQLLIGDTKQTDRKKFIDYMNQGKLNVLFINYKVGSTGLNLPGASVVILLDPAYNLSTEKQAISRSHRIGQKNKVTVYRLIMLDTFELYMLKLKINKEKEKQKFLQEEIEETNISKQMIEFIISNKKY